MSLPVVDGDDFCIAIHASQSDLLNLRGFLKSIPDQIAHLKSFRMTVLAFTDRLEEIRIYHPSTRRNVAQFLLDPIEWSAGTPSLDPVIHFAFDHSTIGGRRKVFVYTGTPLKTYWSHTMLSLCLDIVWLREQGLDIGRKA